MTEAIGPTSVLRFWFEEIEPAQWWKSDPAFDRLVRERFAAVHGAAARAELGAWRARPAGRLAEVIVLDQLSRNMYRGTPLAFAFDAVALVLAQEAVAGRHDLELPPGQRLFLYMPYMHSESAVIHEAAVGLFESLGLPSNLDFELRHKATIDRFGRCPHRDSILGRPSTDEEVEFLKMPGSSFETSWPASRWRAMMSSPRRATLRRDSGSLRRDRTAAWRTRPPRWLPVDIRGIPTRARRS